MSKLFTDQPGDDCLPGAQRRIATVMIMVATFMTVLDGSIVNVALPTIARALRVDPAAAVWVANSYQVCAAMTLVAFAALGDLIGFRRVLIFGLTLFTVTSLGCALCTGLTSLVLMRFLQGMGASAVMSIGPALYRMVFPTRLLGTIFGWNALMVAVTTSVGPTFGGALLAASSWPWLFAINVPFGLVALVLARRVLPVSKPTGKGFDWIGAVLSAVAMCSFVIAVDGLGTAGLAARNSALALLSLMAGAAFIVRQKHTPSPLLPLDIFGSARFTLAAATSFASFIGQGIAFIALPFLFQGTLGYSALASALLFTPWPLAIIFAAPLAGRLADRYSAAVLSTGGLAVLTIGLALLGALPEHATVWNIAWRAFICGLGFGFFQTPNNREILGSAPRSRSGTASGVLAMARTFGQSIGAAIVAIVLAAAALHTANGTGMAEAAIESASTHVSLWIAAAATALACGFSFARIRQRVELPA